MNSDKCSLLINSFIKSHFSYCLLIWMFSNRKSMKKTIHEHYLCFMTNNFELNYEELLELTNEIYLPQLCLNYLMTEACKCLNELSPDVMNDVLTISKHGCNTRRYNFL